MKKKRFLAWGIALCALALAGCGDQRGDPAKAVDTEEVGPKYTAKNGIHVPQETFRSVGLTIAEVAERRMDATLELPLRIYRTNATTILASGAMAAEEAKGVKAGQEVQVLATDGRKYRGTVTAITQTLLSATDSAELLVEIPRGTEGAPIGAFVNGSITIHNEARVAAIPRAALLQCSDGWSVYTVNGDSFVRTPVKVGAANGDFVEIKDGLYPGDQVVLRPVMSLWMTELAAVKGGQACCAVPAKGK